MELKNIYTNKPNSPIISYEVFPPKDNEDKLIQELDILKQFSPSLVSITYGAGGSNKDGSLNLAKRIKTELNLNIMPHFTCICSSKAFIDSYLEEILDFGVKNILALRGDIPKDNTVCHKDFSYAAELVDYINSKCSLDIAVAAYPEGHSATKDQKAGMAHLKDKVDKGASVIYTQMFFNNDYFYNFVELAKEFEINVPIIPGILPITSLQGLYKMTDLCKIEIPSSLNKELRKYQDDKNSIIEIGIDFATHQTYDLLQHKAPGLHFYTLNKSYSTKSVLENIL